MSAAEVCRCLSPEEWRDGICGYCGRQERTLYGPTAPVLPYKTTAQIMAMHVQQKQLQIAEHLRAVAELVASMPGGRIDMTDEGLHRLTGLQVTRDEQRMLVRLAVELQPLATARVLAPEYVPGDEGEATVLPTV